MGRRGIHDEGSRTLQERLKARCGSTSKPPAGCHADLRSALEGQTHDPEKRAPVFGPGHAQHERSLAECESPSRARTPQAVLFASD